MDFPTLTWVIPFQTFPNFPLGPTCFLSISGSWLYYRPLEFTVTVCPQCNIPFLYVSFFTCLKGGNLGPKKHIISFLFC